MIIWNKNKIKRY